MHGRKILLTAIFLVGFATGNYAARAKNETVGASCIQPTLRHNRTIDCTSSPNDTSLLELTCQPSTTVIDRNCSNAYATKRDWSVCSDGGGGKGDNCGWSSHVQITIDTCQERVNNVVQKPTSDCRIGDCDLDDANCLTFLVCGDSPLHLVFALDSSASQDCRRAKTFVAAVVRRLAVSATEVRLAAFTFDTMVRHEIDFQSDKTTFLEAVKSLQCTRGGTIISSALRRGRQLIGSRSPAALVLLSDGHTFFLDTSQTLKQAQLLRAANVTVFAVGVGQIYSAVMAGIASGDDLLISTVDYGKVQLFVGFVIGRLCRVSIDCVVSEWSDVSPCSSTCGWGIKRQNRVILVPPENDGLVCPARLTRSVSCLNINAGCPVDCVLGSWRDQGPCSRSCGSGGRRNQSRTIVVKAENGGQECLTDLQRRVPCNEGPCGGHVSRDCTLSNWTDISPCSVTCGNGFVSQARRIVIQSQFDGKKCLNQLRRTVPCFAAVCPVLCQTSNWINSSRCSVSCGDGFRLQSRTIIDKNQECQENLTRLVRCNDQPCSPIDCIMSTWTVFVPCTKSCGGGQQMRVRHVQQEPRFGGRKCSLQKISVSPCHVQPCTMCNNDPINIIFALDSSSAVRVADFGHLVEFCRSVVSEVDVGLEATLVAAVSFSFTSVTNFVFANYTTKSSLLDAIKRMTYRGGHPSLPIALSSALLLLTRWRRNVAATNVIFVVTSGKTQFSAYLPSVALKLRALPGTRVYFVGISDDVKYWSLFWVASRPLSKFKIAAENSSSLPRLGSRIGRSFCRPECSQWSQWAPHCRVVAVCDPKKKFGCWNYMYNEEIRTRTSQGNLTCTERIDRRSLSSGVPDVVRRKCCMQISGLNVCRLSYCSAGLTTCISFIPPSASHPCVQQNVFCSQVLIKNLTTGKRMILNIVAVSSNSVEDTHCLIDPKMSPQDSLICCWKQIAGSEVEFIPAECIVGHEVLSVWKDGLCKYQDSPNLIFLPSVCRA
eukprot:m.118226 g.118226  ORF g.118226 m.118226 type:complete len:994 (+) comp37641_c0_seq9:2190-5171(+)